jgi:3-isopropylmalate dehydrogenase
VSRARIALLAGDGIGPEVADAALQVLARCLPIEIVPALIGGAAIDATGEPLPAATLELARRCDAVFLGAVGGPKWDAHPVRPEQGLLALRRGLDVYANLRPARDLGLPTPLRRELVAGADLLVVRDLLGGVYFGAPRVEGDDEALDTWRQSAAQTRRVARTAFALARARRRRVTSIDKANVLAASRLWRRTVVEVAAEFPDVELEHRYVDAASFELLAAPRRFDVVLADNLFGDILSDELAAVVGGIGLLASASLGPGPGLFEPVHGSAPDLAGRGIANPTGALLTVALLLTHGLGRADLGAAVERAVAAALAEERTADLGGNASTAEMTRAVERRLARALADSGPSTAAPAVLSQEVSS